MPGNNFHIDTLIVGGGIAGLWLLNVLRAQGYSALLFESESLGNAQTLASQGIIHSGIKYALAGASSPASDALSRAPARWRACLNGDGEVDLRGIKPLAEHCYLFASASGLAKLTAFFATKALRGRIQRLNRPDFPKALRHAAFHGSVYRLEDFVLDTQALIQRLAASAPNCIYRQALVPERCTLDGGGSVRVRLAGGTLAANRLILAAGAGNEALLAGLSLPGIAMQRRPLHQVIVRQAGLPQLFGHWLAGMERAEPRLTITSHSANEAGQGGRLWYLGGQLATSGAALSAADQRRRGRLELETCFPWMDWRRADVATFRIDRAEPRQPAGLRPLHAFAAAAGPCIVCWPTKLALVPDLADRVLSLLPPPEYPSPGALNLTPATVGQAPWVA